MIIAIQKRISILCAIGTRNIRKWDGKKWRALRKNLVPDHIDFSRSNQIQNLVKLTKEKLARSLPCTPFSKILSDPRKVQTLPPYVEIKEYHKRRFSKIGKKILNTQLGYSYKAIEGTLEYRIFYLDQTAEILENYRRIIEVKAFNRMLHAEKEKSNFLKIESQKLPNLIENFDINFQSFQVYANSDLGKDLKLFQYQHFLDEVDSNNPLTDYTQYRENKNLLANHRIEQFLKDKSRNPKLLEMFASDNKTTDIIKIDDKAQEITPLQKELQEQHRLAESIKQYEDSVIQKMDKSYDFVLWIS